MAGAILINEVDGVSMSGVEFGHITQAIRSLLQRQSPDILEEVYRPLDEGGMEFVSLKALDRKAFAVFFEAARRAYGVEQSENPDSPFKGAWREFLERLLADSRFGK